MKRLLFLISISSCLLLSLPGSVFAVIGTDIVRDTRELNVNIKEPVIVVPTSTPTPTPTSSYTIKTPIKTFNVVSAAPTQAPTVQPTQSSSPTQSETTPSVAETIVPTVLPEEDKLNGATVYINDTVEQPSVESKPNTNLDLKEIAGIGLVVFLVLVIVFQSRKGQSKNPQNP